MESIESQVEARPKQATPTAGELPHAKRVKWATQVHVELRDLYRQLHPLEARVFPR
jgi:hypothetical protein